MRPFTEAPNIQRQAHGRNRQKKNCRPESQCWKAARFRKSGALEFRVGEKGGVSVYGLGRFPVTLYYEQWIRLLDSSDALRAFLEENKSKLKLKDKP